MGEAILFDRVLDVSSSDDWWPPVDAARIRLTGNEIEEILNAAALVKAHGLASVRLYSDANEWGNRDEGEATFQPTDGGPSVDYFRSECNQAAVFASGERWEVVMWSAYAKHTSVRLETEAVDLKELRACLQSGGRNGRGLSAQPSAIT